VEYVGAQDLVCKFVIEKNLWFPHTKVHNYETDQSSDVQCGWRKNCYQSKT